MYVVRIGNCHTASMFLIGGDGTEKFSVIRNPSYVESFTWFDVSRVIYTIGNSDISSRIVLDMNFDIRAADDERCKKRRKYEWGNERCARGSYHHARWMWLLGSISGAQNTDNRLLGSYASAFFLCDRLSHLPQAIYSLAAP